MSQHVTVITGASKGIGRAIALRFARGGSAIVGIARHRQETDSVMAELQERYGTRCLSIACDVSAPVEVVSAFSQILETFGRVDVLINNAGVGEFVDFDRLPDDAWRLMLDVNLMGAVYCSRQALRSMRERGRGMIVNISSICGLRGYAQCSAYCASKFALVGFSEALGKEVAGFEIPIYAVCPDIVDTGFAGNRNSSLTRPERMLTAREVAAFVQDLACRRPPSQICRVRLHPLASLFSAIGLPVRKISVKRIRRI